MDSFLAKILISLASILGVFVSGSYIQSGADNLSLDFKTGEQFPIFYSLNVRNIGPQGARFDISSDSPWLFVYREGQPGTNSLTLSDSAVVNFILEIHPERLADGIYESEVLIKAINLQNYEVLDSKTIGIVLNKNVVPTPTLPTSSPTPEVEITPTPTAAASPSPSPAPVQTPRITAPAKSPAVSPSPPPGPVSPTPGQPEGKVEKTAPILRQLEFILDSLRSFLNRFLRF